MDNLKALIIFYISKFPQKLGRTKLIKAIYLLDCEWYKLYGATFSGLAYIRDYNGPFDTTFYSAKDELCSEGIIRESEYFYPGGKGYEFNLNTGSPDTQFDPFAKYIAANIVEELKDDDLEGFLRKAYSTEPMISVQELEKNKGFKSYGGALNMAELNKSPKPLFSLDQVKRAAKDLDQSNRGSDQEYAEVVNEEIEQLRIYRERAAEAWKLVQ